MLQVFISNKIRIRGANIHLKAAITAELTFDNPEYIKRKRKRVPVWGVEKKIQLYTYDIDLIVPRGFQQRLAALVAEHHNIDMMAHAVMDQTLVDPIDFGPWNIDYMIGAAPREYQREAVDAVFEKGNGVLVSPAGSGKTAMGLYIVKSWQQPAIWLTHTIDLMKQTAAAAAKYMPEIGKVGMIGGGEMEYGDGKLIVATVQTMQSRPEIVDHLNRLIGTVVVDEAHHFPSHAFIDVAGRFKAAHMLGLTATPQRKDGMEMYLTTGIGPVLHEVPRADMYDAGAIIKPEVKFIYTDFDFDQASDRTEWNSVDAGGDDMDYGLLMRTLTRDKDRTELVAKTIGENAPGNYSLVLSESVRYCYTLMEEIQARFPGLRMAVVHGGLERYKWQLTFPEHPWMIIEEKRRNDGRMWLKVENYTEEEYAAWQVTPKKRAEILEAAANKQIDILFATQLAREGLDIPHLNIGHMVTPKRGDASSSQKNGAAVEQEIGRIMRPDPSNPGKRAVWYDYVDYGVGVLQSQYGSRRSVYRRLGLQLPKKPKTESQKIEDFLGKAGIFDLPC